MLGHTKLATTQIYARIVDQTVSREMDKLSAALSGTSFTSTVENPQQKRLQTNTNKGPTIAGHLVYNVLTYITLIKRF